jgi:hypothetical protein
MTTTMTDAPAADVRKDAATLVVFSPSTTAESAAFANILARLGIKLVTHIHPSSCEGGLTAADVQQLRSHIQDLSPAAVLAGCPWSLALCALTAARQTSRPFIYRLDEPLDADEADLDRHATVAQAADLVLLSRAAQGAALVAQGVAPEKLRLAADAQAQASAVLGLLRFV